MVVVLVVSSEERIGRHVRSVLGSQGWWVTTASDREEALRAAADQQPALVIVDCEIESAAELVRVFGAKNGGPGVLLLEPPDGGDAFHAFEAGADQILSKPPRAKALLEAAERVMSLPYQAAGGRAADQGEKLSADEIFGELLVELDAIEPGTAAGAGPRDGEPSAEAETPQAKPGLESPPASGNGVGDRPGKQEVREASGGKEGSNPASAASADGQGGRAAIQFDPKSLGAEVQEVEPPQPPAPPVPPAPEAPAIPVPPPDPPPVDPSVDWQPEERSEVATSEASPSEEGRFGQYRLEERIAVGGMAEVWRASMLGLEGFRKTVAIKKILPHLAENDEFVTMFIEEAKLAAQLSHENLVEIYDLGKIGDSFFIAMEYVDGKDLRGLMNRLRQASEPMPIGLALLVAADVARGLEYAHNRQDAEGRALDLVHRDVSPRNVLIGYDGRVRLCDFGVAKAVSSVVQTQIGALKGKLQYMSPEQASGRSVDHRSDIYSLGSVMYEMISGRRLYEGDNEISLLDAARAGNFDDPRKHCPGLPQEVRGILIKSLAKRPSGRYQSAGALEEDLRALLRTLDPAPDAQALGLFVKELFAERGAQGADPESKALVAAFEQGGGTTNGLDGETRSLNAGRLVPGTKVARFWWGVAAGLLVAGLGAVLLAWLAG